MPGYSPSISGSHARLIPSPGTSESLEEPELAHQTSLRSSESAQPLVAASPTSFDSGASRGALGAASVLRQATVSREYPGETPNPYRHSQPHVASTGIASPMGAFDDAYAVHDDPRGARGINLVDSGPVHDPGNVRRVARQSARRSTQQVMSPAVSSPLSPGTPQSSRFSRQSQSSSALPPGAAAPMPRFGQ